MTVESCPNCGGGVFRGESLCSYCGGDVETEATRLERLRIKPTDLRGNIWVVVNRVLDGVIALEARVAKLEKR